MNAVEAADNTNDFGVVHGDAAEVLPRLIAEKKRFDVVIADPPYNIGKNFGNNRADMPIKKYVQWAKGWIDDCRRLLTGDGLLYLYGFPEIVARIAAQYPIEEQRWLAWHYTNKAVPSSKFWQRSHETILCLWKPGRPRPHLELDQIREPYTESFMKNAAGRERKDTPSRYGRTGRKTLYNAHPNGALPRDVLKFPALAGGAGRSERWFLCRDCGGKLYPPKELEAHRGHDILKHPTQKPMELTKRLLLSRMKRGGGGYSPIPVRRFRFGMRRCAGARP